MEFIIRKTTADDFCFADEIVKEMEESAKIRGTGIAKRSPEYIKVKMEKGDAVIAITHNGIWAGFCYIETWTNGDYASNSGLIVSPRYRNIGLASRIKESVFNVTREKYPNAKLFGITTGLAVMKINSRLGYHPVPFSELTQDDQFWDGCQSCVNYSILQSKGRKNCLCTGMLFVPPKEKNKRDLSYYMQNY